MTNFREQTLFEKLLLLRKGKTQRKPLIKSKIKELNVPEKTSGRMKCEEEIIQLCFTEKLEIRKLFYDHLDKAWFSNNIFRHIFESVYIHLHSSSAPNANVVMDSLKEEDRSKLTKALFDLDRKKPTLRLAIDCMKQLETYILKDDLEKQRSKLKSENVSSEKMNEILKSISTIQNKIQKIKNKYI